MLASDLNIHNIMCPTDFSDFAASAFAESVRLARWFGARVTVVHVMPFTTTIAGAMGYFPGPVDTDGTERQATLAELQRFVDATEHAGVPVEMVCREGDPCHEIRDLTHERGADLVVMGTHGRSGFKRLVLGSVTEALLNHPPAPVLTVNRNLPHRKGLYRTVLCATDAAEGTAGTVAVALAIADEGAKRLVVLKVIGERLAVYGGPLELAAVDGLHQLIPDDARKSYVIERRVSFGDSDGEILGIAAEEAADLVVVGTRGGDALGCRFGSTVRRVVRDATCPVMVVPAGHVRRMTGVVRRRDTEPIVVSRHAGMARVRSS